MGEKAYMMRARPYAVLLTRVHPLKDVLERSLLRLALRGGDAAAAVVAEPSAGDLEKRQQQRAQLLARLEGAHDLGAREGTRAVDVLRGARGAVSRRGEQGRRAGAEVGDTQARARTTCGRRASRAISCSSAFSTKAIARAQKLTISSNATRASTPTPDSSSAVLVGP